MRTIPVTSLRPDRYVLDQGSARYRGGQITALDGTTASIKVLVETNSVRTLTCAQSLVPAGAQSVGCPVYCRLLTYAEATVTAGATNYWKLDETSGTTAVDSIGGANGTISGGVTLNQPGALSDGDKAMTFNGSTGKIVTAGNVTLPVPAWTVEGWLLWTGGTYQTVMNTAGSPVPGAYDSFAVFLASGVLTFRMYVAATGNPTQITMTGGTVSSGVWHHIVVTVNGTTITPYLDGVQRAFSAALATAPVGTTQPVEMGVIGFQGLFTTGSLDDVAIYPLALTPAQIAAKYTAGLTGYYISEVVGSSGPSAQGGFRPGIIPRSLTNEPLTWWRE